MSALLQVRNISRAFRTTLAVDDVSFEVQPGELLGLIGPNGAGKSTLFNLVAGAIAPSWGQIIFDGKPIAGWKSHDIARVGVARTFQIPKPYRQLSVIENVMLSAFLREKSIAGARKLAEAPYKLAGKFADGRPAEKAGGGARAGDAAEAGAVRRDHGRPDADGSGRHDEIRG
jgi:ABC-type branched-subunit amino acid transport system ATPase component